MNFNELLKYFIDLPNSKCILNTSNGEFTVSNESKISLDKFILKKINNTDCWEISYKSNNNNILTSVKKYKEINESLELIINLQNSILNKSLSIESIEKGNNLKKSLECFLSNGKINQDFKDETLQLEEKSNTKVIGVISEDKEIGVTNVTTIENKTLMIMVNIGYCIPHDSGGLITQNYYYWLLKDELNKYPLLKGMDSCNYEDEIELIKKVTNNVDFKSVFLFEEMKEDLNNKKANSTSSKKKI